MEANYKEELKGVTPIYAMDTENPNAYNNQLWDNSNPNPHILTFNPLHPKADAVAKIVCEAISALNDFDLTPAELLENNLELKEAKEQLEAGANQYAKVCSERDELLRNLKRAVDFIDVMTPYDDLKRGDSQKVVTELKTAIQKVNS